MHTDTRRSMGQLALLLGSLLLLLICATENEASKHDCKATVNDFYNLYCRDVIKEKRARKDHLRKTRDTEGILEESAGRYPNISPTIGLKEFLAQSHGGEESTKFVVAHKRNPVRGSRATTPKKALKKCAEDLLGFDISKEDLEELYDDAVPRHTRQLSNEEKVLKLFKECCPDEHECFEKFKHLHLRECHPKYKRLRKP